jgi:hypothetical protein
VVDEDLRWDDELGFLCGGQRGEQREQDGGEDEDAFHDIHYLSAIYLRVWAVRSFA